MQLPIYTKALSELSVPILNKFVKDMNGAGYNVEIPNWSKRKASEKRSGVLAALGNSSELRKEFVAFYDNETGNENDWSEWETADLPAEDATPGADTMTVQTDTENTTDVQTASGEVPASDAPVPAPATHSAPSQFVEGAFHQMVADVAGLSPADALANLREIENDQGFNHLRMGAVLAHIHNAQHYATAGHDNMRSYLAAEMPHLQYRKAMFLVSNANKVAELGITEKELDGVSWAALRHITGVMTATNYKEWLDAARSNTHVALIQSVKDHLAAESGALPKPETDNAPKTTIKTFNLFPDQTKTVNDAIEKAKVEGNTDSTGAALDVIAASYVGKPPSDASIAQVLPDMSVEGLTKMFSKLNADHGVQGALQVVFEAVENIWPDVDINVQIPEQKTAAE